MRRTSVVVGLLAVAGTVLMVLAAGAALVPGTASAAEWAWPLAGPHSVVRPFDPPAHRYGTGHRGADLPAAPGAAVTAAGSGQVSYAGPLAGRGVVVVVHGSLRTTYEPVLAAVSVGQPVAAGELLGSLEPGHPGCPAAACLHWGLRRGDDYLDPVGLVAAGPVRLLPPQAEPGRLSEPGPPEQQASASAAVGEPAAASGTRSLAGVAAVTVLAAGTAAQRRARS